MFCRTCGEPCALQFDYCHKHREERKKELHKNKIANMSEFRNILKIN